MSEARRELNRRNWEKGVFANVNWSDAGKKAAESPPDGYPPYRDLTWEQKAAYCLLRLRNPAMTAEDAYRSQEVWPSNWRSSS